MSPSERAAAGNAAQAGTLSGELGIVWELLEAGHVVGGLIVAHRHLAPLTLPGGVARPPEAGFVHAGSVVSLADTACGFGCAASLPPGAVDFTTVELKSNFLSTARLGEAVGCEARLVHGGRTTQVWDATVVNRASGKTMALFRCTQLLLSPRA